MPLTTPGNDWRRLRAWLRRTFAVRAPLDLRAVFAEIDAKHAPAVRPSGVAPMTFSGIRLAESAWVPKHTAYMVGGDRVMVLSPEMRRRIADHMRELMENMIHSERPSLHDRVFGDPPPETSFTMDTLREALDRVRIPQPPPTKWGIFNHDTA